MTYSRIILTLTAFLLISFKPIVEPISNGLIKGKASYYSSRFEGRRTAFGEVFRNHQLTAAHRTFAHNTLLEVTNLKNGKSVVVRVNDRGPWTKRHLIDVSRAAAEKLGIVQAGVGEVSVRVVGEKGKLFESEALSAEAATAVSD